MKRIAVIAFAIASLVLLSVVTGCWRPFCPINSEPVAVIDSPPFQGPGVQVYGGPVVRFAWHCEPDCKPTSVRFLSMQVTDPDGVYDPNFDIIADLNENPSRYEERWSEWMPCDPSQCDDCTTVIGDDEQLLEFNRVYLFALQAIGYHGRVTRTFDPTTNARLFMIKKVTGPLLTVCEPYLGCSRFFGTGMRPVKYELPSNVPLNFRWEADASDYGGRIVCYRYGWDVADINNPDDWESTCRPDIKTAPERRLYSGVHTLYVEVIDDGNRTTLGQIQIEVIPFTMEMNLLWVDDFFSTDPQSPLWETPSESNHDAFWLDICSRATGFVPDRDVYQCTSGLAVTPPSIRQIGRYKNIIWTYSSTYNAWRGVIEFTPESIIGTASNVPINYLPLFLARGGHLWTLGRSEKAGGLAAAFNERYMPLMPASFKDEMYPGPEDTSGVFCMPYKDYCVKSVDKVWGTFKTGDMPPGLIRSLDRDAMRFAYKDAADYITAQYPALPERLDLWEEVTKPGRFFDPMVRGFLYVEAYDPEYYMNYRLETSQPCFHPIYRMRSRNSLSVINNQTIAIWVTKYEDVVPEVQTGIAVPARSVHFGFPLWFFDRTAVDQIVDVVFDEWGILAAP